MTAVEMQPLLATPFEGLSQRQRFGVAVLFATVVLFSGVVEMRSAFMQRRMTDLDTYLRAAWSIRTGSDPYGISDENGLHYYYPPLLAILLVPLADPPPGADRSGMLPFPASVAIWYTLSVLCLMLGTNCLASALEQTSGDPHVRALPRGCQRWWALRVVPVLICLIPIGGTLSRGQVNLVVLAALCAMAAAVLRGHCFTAGLWLSAAICIKVFPIILVLYPLWRRNRRCLAGCGLGLVLGLALIPTAVLGPTRVLVLGQAWARVALPPAMAEGKEPARDREHLGSGDNQSFVMVLHRIVNTHLERTERPLLPSRATRLTHLSLATLLTGVTLFIGRRRAAGATVEATFVGLLMVTMLLVLPVCHLHYFSLTLPLVMSLVALGLENQGSIAVRRLFRYVAASYPVANALPHLPGLDVLRQFGLAMAATVVLWLVGVATLWMLRPRCADGHPALPLVRR